MVNKHISTDRKECALRLWEQGWTMDDICSAFCVSPSSMYRWRKLQEEWGTPQNPPSPLMGRARLVSLGVLTAIRDVFEKDSTVMLHELQFHLAIHHDLPIAISTLQETLDCAGLTRKVLRKIAKEWDEARHNNFRACIRNPANFSRTGIEFPFVRGTRYTLTAAMSTKGYIATCIVEGSMNASQFFDFVIEDVMPHMKPYPDVQSVIVLDNCRIHHSEILKDVLNDSGGSTHSLADICRHSDPLPPAVLSRPEPHRRIVLCMYVCLAVSR
ncbi:hypothetical protein C8F01DRAFT_988117 [Mycena amicta]|nr:hypothetical protein C8F01DRAFT_988117 [Mycena amicta]